MILVTIQESKISRQGEYRRRQIRGRYRSPTQERGNYYAK
jgi:hypothetical protein